MAHRGPYHTILMILLLQCKSNAWTTLARRVRASRLFSSEGAVHVSSIHVTHVLASHNEPTVEQAIAANLKMPWTKSATLSVKSEQLSPLNLLELGAVWYMKESAVRDPQPGDKPQRLSLENATMKLKEDDYLRIHHSPRRFPNVYNFNWTGWHSDPGGIVVDRGRAFWVINKPANIPVHPTVDNIIENVAEQIRKDLPVGSYVSVPQRLDQNTSGLFVVARSKVFANYYANLLRSKTEDLLGVDKKHEARVAIQKGYKCLLCLIPKEGSSMSEVYRQLKSYDLLQHFLEPSIRAPKNFARIQVDKSWAESLLRLTYVGEAFPLYGSRAAQQLRSHLWESSDSVPVNCVGVVEVHVELLTGRTHQIRGQFKTEGYPLVGDAQYGGAIPLKLSDADDKVRSGIYSASERLALRCFSLKFLDPDVITKKDGTEDLQPSNRWNEYRLDDSWWAPFLEMYKDNSIGGDTTTTLEDLAYSTLTAQSSVGTKSDLLPPHVELSPGINKYVLVKATSEDTDQILWFVKSASPAECGGPYHANVAEVLVGWLEAVQYTVEVTGGGRIDYNPEKNYAKVYGFSYGFGRGDHAQAAALIGQHSDVFATYDNSASLY